jgi:hypothetical protein
MASKDFTDRLTWEGKARRNPLWAVMSVDEFAHAEGDPSSWTAEQLALFFEKGRALFDIFLRPSLRLAGESPGLRREEGLEAAPPRGATTSRRSPVRTNHPYHSHAGAAGVREYARP